VARAQQASKIYRIGIVSAGPVPPSKIQSAFFDGLRDLGWIEGKNIAFEQRFADNHLERLPDLAADLVHLHEDVIVAPCVRTRTGRRSISECMTSSSAWPSRPFLAPGFRFAGWRPVRGSQAPARKKKRRRARAGPPAPACDCNGAGCNRLLWRPIDLRPGLRTPELTLSNDIYLSNEIYLWRPFLSNIILVDGDGRESTMQSDDYRRLYDTCRMMAQQSSEPDMRARWLALANNCEDLLRGSSVTKRRLKSLTTHLNARAAINSFAA
jgi:hypothetical protein